MTTDQSFRYDHPVHWSIIYIKKIRRCMFYVSFLFICNMLHLTWTGLFYFCNRGHYKYVSCT